MSKSISSRILESLEEAAPTGLIVAVIVTLVFEGFFQYIFWWEMFPRLNMTHRGYTAGSIATFIGMFRLWFLVMSSRDIAAGNIRVAMLGIVASLALLVYCIWECSHIGARWSNETDQHTVVAMLIFTTCIVIVAETRIMMSRYGSWRNSAQQAAEAIKTAQEAAQAGEEAAQAAQTAQAAAEVALTQEKAARTSDTEQYDRNRKQYEKEAERLKTEAEAGQVLSRIYQAEAEELRTEADRNRNEADRNRNRYETEAEERDRKYNELRAEAEQLKAEVLRYRAEAEARDRKRAERAERTGSVGTSDDTGSAGTGTGTLWPELLAETYRNFVEKIGRNPTPAELASAAGTSDKTERKYREQYQNLLKQQS